MWHASSGDQTFSGSYGLMLAEGIRRMIDEMNQLHGIDEEFEIGLRAFDLQTREQKSWSLHQVAFGLLDESTAIVELNAYLEATIAAIFYQLDGCIQIEQDDEATFASESDDDRDYFFWRKLVLAAYESVGGNNPEDLEDDEKTLTPESNDIDEWRFAFGMLEEQIFWDADYEDDDMIDMVPEHGSEMRNMFGVADDYYTAIPNDPKPKEAKKLLKDAATFCDRIIESNGL